MHFIWDEHKNKANKRKHGIGFEVAMLIFEDPFIISVLDHRFEYTDERWQSIGMIDGVAVYVAHSIWEEIDGQEVIRIISARAATPAETREYRIKQRNSKTT